MHDPKTVSAFTVLMSHVASAELAATSLGAVRASLAFVPEDSMDDAVEAIREKLIESSRSAAAFAEVVPTELFGIMKDMLAIRELMDVRNRVTAVLESFDPVFRKSAPFPIVFHEVQHHMEASLSTLEGIVAKTDATLDEIRKLAESDKVVARLLEAAEKGEPVEYREESENEEDLQTPSISTEALRQELGL